MRKTVSLFERSLMLVLALLPLLALIFSRILTTFYTGVIWFVAQTFISTLTGFLPGYIGNYTVTDVIRYENSRTADPNPDREAVHELVKEGHRFPVRLPVDVILLALGVVLSFMLPSDMFTDMKLTYRLVFTALMFMLNASAMYGAASYSIWTEIPGMIVGFAVYLGCALFLHFSHADNSLIQPIVSICALMYLFFGGICLNRASLAGSVSTVREHKSAPRQIVLKNRRIVLGFASIAVIVSFVGPIRSGFIWLANRFLDLLGIIGNILRGGPAVKEDTPAFMQMMEGGAAPTSEAVEMELETEATGSMISVYIFFGIVLLGLCWIIFDGIRKLINKLSKLIENFASGINDGYYDEREAIMEPEEARRQMRALLRDRLKKLFERETPWEKLTGREKARRLLRDLYLHRGRKLRGLRSMTATEALSKMGLASTEMAQVYDRARYSEQEINSEHMDTLRKEIKP